MHIHIAYIVHKTFYIFIIIYRLKIRIVIRSDFITAARRRFRAMAAPEAHNPHTHACKALSCMRAAISVR